MLAGTFVTPDPYQSTRADHTGYGSQVPLTTLFGATSMTGWSLMRRYGSRITPVCNPFVRAEAAHRWRCLRLEDSAALRALFSQGEPDVLIHCGGICDVGRCEQDPAYAELLNVHSIDVLLDCLPTQTRLIYCSTDHVFGDGPEPHDEASPTRPISVYGHTRAAAEQLILDRRPGALIVRSGLAVGPSIEGRTGHLDWLRYRHGRGLPMTVVRDEVRSAVWAEDLADRIWALAASDATGLAHIPATESVARPALAAYLCERFGIAATVAVERRADRRHPHLGDVTLATRRSGPLAAPLPAVRPSATRKTDAKAT
jgi:dTDP-4-dehydrorhamnose reductase